MTELQPRGLKDIFVACVDSLTGFPEALESVYPQTRLQLCIVHMAHNSLRYVSWKDRKAVAADLKQIYRSVSAEAAEQALDVFAERRDEKYPSISRSCRKHWPNLIALFDYPDKIRKIIYTTNAIESLNSVIRKAINHRRIFSNDGSAIKLVYLAIQQASKKWSTPLRNWKSALNRFSIEYEDRLQIQ